jgi:acetyl esterase
MPAATVVSFHGGGWVAGDINTHDRNGRTLAIQLEAVVLSVDYRRPPETAFPGTFDDCLAATRWAAENIAELGGEGNRLAVAGDSAGGNLAAAVALACRDQGPRLAGQFLIYPATDLAGGYASPTENAKYPSRVQNAEGYFLTSEAMRWFAGQYVSRSADAMDPRASPMLSRDLKGLPPAVICTAEFDPLRDEGEAYARKLKEAGVQVDAVRYNGTIHDFVLLNALRNVPSTQAAIEQATAGIREHLVP